MIIPDWNPCKGLKILDGIEIRTIRCMSLSVVIKCAELSVRLGNSSNRPPPPVSPLSVLVYEITEMNHIVDAFFSRHIPETIEEPEIIVRA